MNRQRSRWQPGTIEIGPVEPREWNAPGSHDGFACEDSRGIREGFQPGIEIGVELARYSVQRQEGFAQQEKVERHGMALQSQLPHDLERGVQWMGCCFPKNDPLSMLGISQPSVDPPFLSKMFNAIAKKR